MSGHEKWKAERERREQSSSTSLAVCLITSTSSTDYVTVCRTVKKKLNGQLTWDLSKQATMSFSMLEKWLRSGPPKWDIAKDEEIRGGDK